MSTHTTAARELRRRQTAAEAHLWQRLRAYQLDGHYFRRQYPIGGFVVDFICRKSRLIIEVEGGYHHDQIAADLERARYLTGLGYTVLRLSNAEVLNLTSDVLATIRNQLSSAPLSPWERGRGEV